MRYDMKTDQTSEPKSADVTFLPTSKGSLDIIHKGDGFALIDGCMPVALAERFISRT